MSSEASSSPAPMSRVRGEVDEGAVGAVGAPQQPQQPQTSPPPDRGCDAVDPQGVPRNTIIDSAVLPLHPMTLNYYRSVNYCGSSPHGVRVLRRPAPGKATLRDKVKSLVPLPSWEDFVGGMFSGFAITVVGHPFDTVKVRLQTQDILQSHEMGLHAERFRGGWDCVLRTVKHEGPLALYRGMEGPLLTVPILNAIVFASYEQGLDFFRRRNAQAEHVQRSRERGEGGRPTFVDWNSVDVDDVEVSMMQISLAGGWAGLINSCVVGPVELVKSRLQVQMEARGAKRDMKGPWAVMCNIVRRRGVRGLFLGMNTTVVREVPAYMGQFYAYELIKRLLTPVGKSSDDIGPWRTMTAGAMAGVTAWLVSYPQDIIKSRIQIQPDTHPRRYPNHAWLRFDGGFVACGREIFAENGFKGFWKGFGPCVTRALPANAAGFLTYELVMKYLRKNGKD